MRRSVLVILALLVTSSLLHLDMVSGQDIASCEPHTVCVHQGNYLKYQTIAGDVNSTAGYTFEDMISPDTIKVKKWQYVGNQVQNDTLILDLQTSYYHSEHNNSTLIPFIEILPTPIQYNQSDIAVSETIKRFNGFNRTTLTAIQTSSNSSLLMEYDLQTGILLSAHSLGLTKPSGKPLVTLFFTDLVDTNIITSDSLTNTVIPSWIKNTAGWWADGTINDDDFIKAIQYLVSKDIIQIPHGSSGNSSSQEIPKWIKNNAGWWAHGKISDNEFISGIQYLINSSIVKI